MCSVTAGSVVAVLCKVEVEAQLVLGSTWCFPCPILGVEFFFLTKLQIAI